MRAHDGFDAELLLAASSPKAEVEHLKLLALARGAPRGAAASLLALLDRGAVECRADGA